MVRFGGRGFERVSKLRAGDGRGGRLTPLSPKGLQALRGWLSPPLPEWVVGVPPDSLRTRLRFMKALSPGKRTAFIDDARRRLEDHIEVVRRDCRATRGLTDPYRYLVARGALSLLKARRAWLREVARHLRAPGRRVRSGRRR